MLDEIQNSHYDVAVPKRLALDEAQLLADYGNGQSAYAIAKKLGVSHDAILCRLHKLGAEMRSSTEQIKMRAEREANRIKIVPHLQEILDGLLLSDGSLSFNRPHTTASLRMEQHPDRREWLELLQQDGVRYGLELRIDGSVFHKPSYIRGRRLPGGRYIALRSLNYVELASERVRWYPQGEKTVPQDLALTPTTLLHWFCGDGRGGDRKGTLGFCTDDFSEAHAQFLVDRLGEDLKIEASKQRNGTTSRGRPRFMILIGKRNAACRVKDLIGDSLPACFKYKFKHVRPLSTSGPGRRLSRSDLDVIKGLPRTTLSRAVKLAAARGVHVERTTVWRIWNKE